MRIILARKYLVDMTALAGIVQVEEIGDWSNRHYKVVGEPEDFEVVPDSKVVCGDAAIKVEEQTATDALKKAQKELEVLKLTNARRDAVDRIIGEKRGVSREDAESFVKTHSMIYSLQGVSSEDVRKWKRKQGETA